MQPLLVPTSIGYNPRCLATDTQNTTSDPALVNNIDILKIF